MSLQSHPSGFIRPFNMLVSTRQFTAFGICEVERVLMTSPQVSICGLEELGTVTISHGYQSPLVVTVLYWYKKCVPIPCPRQTKVCFMVTDWFWTGCKWKVGWGLIDSREGGAGLLGRHTERKLSLAKLVPVYWNEKKRVHFLNAEDFWNFQNKRIITILLSNCNFY